MKKGNKKHLDKQYIDYWKGFFSSISDDTPDGAWHQMHIDLAQWQLDNWDYEFLGDKPDIDAYTLVSEYFELLSEEQENDSSDA